MVTSCGESQETRLKRGVMFVKQQLESVNKSPMASMAFTSQMEMGGTVLTYLAACMGPQTDIPPVTSQDPESPWVIVVRDGPAENQYTIEGFGPDLAKPLVTETITVVPMKTE